MFDNRRLAIMDSGVGGITVLSEAMKLLPNEDYLFYGDNGNMPYGEKNEEEIRRVVLDVFEKLYQMNVKAIVIACNTATSVAVEQVRKSSDIPILSIEPAIKPAIDNHTGKILMLATAATIGQKRYKKLKERFDLNNQIIDVACHEWAETIENNIGNSKECDRVIEKRLGEFKGEKVDALVLGCTHFPIVKDRIKAYTDGNMLGERAFYDGGRATALQLVRVMKNRNILANRREEGDLIFQTSGIGNDIKKMKDVLEFCQNNL